MKRKLWKSPDEVCVFYAKKRGALSIRKLDRDTILIEGKKRDLEFLGELLLAQSGFSDCGFQIGPKCAGSWLFSKKSRFGLYIHRPCHKGPTKRG